jgi:hypothetical protein
MTFTIANSGFVFDLQLNEQNQLATFTATREGSSYLCYIQLERQDEVAELVCCTPQGCVEGPCKQNPSLTASATKSY